MKAKKNDSYTGAMVWMLYQKKYLFYVKLGPKVVGL
jgi:hypothetical protein